MTELDLWNHLWMASGGQGAWFLALGFLSWVGLRAGQNIYNNSDTPVVMKLAGTVFCLFIAQGWVYNFAFSEWNANGVANAMKSIGDAGETLSPYATELILATDPGAAFSLMPTVMQGLFVASILVMSVLPMWVKKS
jgi:hypothetical protein|tara:strand:- start:1277 stop:1687 length:411 start_codon:yes stop_codon:yes gene_type:complete